MKQILHDVSAQCVTISHVLHTITPPKVSNSWLATKEHKISVHFIDVRMQAGVMTVTFLL